MAIVTLVAQGETTTNVAFDVPVTGVATSEVFLVHTSYHTASRPSVRMFGGSNLTATQIAQPYLGTQAIATYIQTGFSGSGNITLDGDLDGITWEYTIYRISGLINPSSLSITNTPWYRLNGVDTGIVQTPSDNYNIQVPVQSAAPGQVAFLLGAASVGNPTSPGDKQGLGWIVDHTGSGSRPHNSAHLVPTTVGNLDVTVKAASAGSYLGGTLFVLGDPAPRAQVIETKNGTIASDSTTGSVTLDTAVVPTDLIAVVMHRSSASGSPTFTLSGWGGAATWTYTSPENVGGTPRLSYVTTTGMTGASTITMAVDSASLGAAFSVFVIRGLTSQATKHVLTGGWGGNTGEHLITPIHPSAPGQVVIATGFRGTTASTPDDVFPNNPSPKSGWTKTRGTTVSIGGVSTNMWNSYLNPTEPSATGGSTPYSEPTSTVGGIYMWVIGEPTYGPWTSTFGASATVDVPFTDVNPDDMFVAIYSKPDAGTTGVSGMGTWTPFHDYQVNASQTRLYVATMTGASGSGNITFTSDASATSNQYTLYLFRGLQNRTIAASQATTWYATDGVVNGAATSTSAGTEKGLVGLPTARGQHTIVAGVSEGANVITFPSSPQPPASSGRWMLDSAPTNADGRHVAGRASPDAPAFVRSATRTVAASWQGSVALEVGAPLPITPAPYIVETKSSVLPSNTATPIVLDTTLVATDIVVVLFNVLFVATGTITGSPSMTWTNVLGGSGNPTLRNNSWAMRGAISTGNVGTRTVSINPGGSTTVGVVYVIRGLPAAPTSARDISRLTQVINSTYSSTFARTKNAATRGGPGQVVLTSALYEGGSTIAKTLPASPSPELGWTYDYSDGTVITSAHDSLTSYGKINGSTYTPSDAYVGTSTLVFGQPQADAVVVETRSFSPPASTTMSVNLATTLLPADVVIVLSSMNANDPAQMVFSIGSATENLVFSDVLTTGGARYRVSYFTGLTGTPSFGTTTLSGATTTRVTVMVARGLIGPIAPTVVSAGWNSTNNSAATDFGVSSMLGTSQLAVFMGGAAAGTGTTFPSNQTPLEWKVMHSERDPGKQMSAYYRANEVGPVANYFQTAGAVSAGAVMVVFGQATGISLPFVGWGGSV